MPPASPGAFSRRFFNGYAYISKRITIHMRGYCVIHIDGRQYGLFGERVWKLRDYAMYMAGAFQAIKLSRYVDILVYNMVL